MQLRQLQTFVAIAEAGTLTAAAARLYKTQSAVSHDLQTLESTLGTSLVDRGGQRVTLTPPGVELLRHARDLLLRVEAARRAVAAAADGDGGRIRIAALPSVAPRVLDAVIDFRRSHPAVRFDIATDSQSVLIDWLIAGNIELAVAEPELLPEVEGLPLATERLLVVVHRDHPLAAAAQLGAHELRQTNFLGFTPGLSARLAEQFFVLAGGLPEPLVEVSDVSLTLTLIEQNLGYAVLPESSLPTDRGSLTGIEPTPTLEQPLALIRRRNAILAEATESFAAQLAAHWPGRRDAPTARLPTPSLSNSRASGRR